MIFRQQLRLAYTVETHIHADHITSALVLRREAGSKIAFPKFIDHAVAGNRLCGVCPADLPENLDAYCARMTESPQG